MARKENKGKCPRHGLEYMVMRDGAYYCICPTPNEIGKLCFYHPDQGKHQTNIKKGREGGRYITDKDPDYQPNVMKVIFDSWDNNKYVTRRMELM